MARIQEWLEEGLRLHKAGSFANAEEHYRKVLAKQPRQVDALYLLGRLKYQQGNPQAAEPLLRAATKADPSYALAYLTLALVCEQLGRDQESVEHFREAFRLDSKSSQAAYHLANTLVRQGQDAEAVQLYRKAIELDPRSAAAYNNLGLLHQKNGHWHEALECLAQAIEADPSCVAAYSNRANLLKQRGRLADAIALQRRAVEKNPTSSEAQVVLGRLLRESGDYSGAVAACQKAATCDLKSFTAVNELGKSYQVHGMPVEAEEAYRLAVNLDPQVAETWNNLGTAVLQQQRLGEALACYEKAVAIDPQYASAWSNLGNAHLDCDDTQAAAESLRRAAALQERSFPWEVRIDTLCPALYDSTAEIDELRAKTMEALERHRASGRQADLRDLLESACQPSFNYPFHGRDDRPLKEAFAAVFAPLFPSESPPLIGAIPHVGVVITHDEWAFRRSVGALFDHLDPKVVRVTIICTPAGIAKLREFFTNPQIGFLPMAVDVQRSIADIRAARFDFLYHWEVATTPLSYFLPFLRLAPIQVTSWGIQVTTGIPAMDYYLSSALVETAESDRHYSEQLYRLKTMMSCQPRMPAPSSPRPRGAYGLSEADHVYLCPQQLGKFHPDFDPILREILERDPEGKLVIIEGKHPRVREKLMQRLRRTLGTVADRIHFVPRLQGEEYTSLYQIADVLLDPIHFGGVNTTYDALSLNKAVLTMPSQLFRCRYTLGCYKQMGYEECVAHNSEEYVTKAVRFGTEREYRHGVETELAERTDALFNHAPSILELQEFFAEAHARAKRGEGKSEWLPSVEPSTPAGPPARSAESPVSMASGGGAHPGSLFAPGRPIAVTFFEPTDPGYAAVWKEVAELVADGLETLGERVLRLSGTVQPDAAHVVVGELGIYAPRILDGVSYAVYRLLPEVPSNANLSARVLSLLRGAEEVWDFAPANMAIWEGLGIRSVRHVPIGFHEKQRRLARADQNVDVVLLASRNGRQAEIYHRLAKECQVAIASSLQGKARDQLLASAKVILSVSSREGDVVDEPAIGFLLANRCCVVAETALELPLATGVAYAAYDELAAQCLGLVSSNQERYRRAKAGFETIRSRPMAEGLRVALEESRSQQ